MKKTIRTLLLTLLLGINLFNTGTINHITTTVEYIEEYSIDLHAFEGDEDLDSPNLW